MEPNVADNFVEAFNKALADIEAGAKEAGSSITEICRENKISRTTPDRWKANTPNTVKLIARMQAAVARKKAEFERKQHEAA